MYSNKRKRIPNNLRKYRLTRGLKQKEVASILGLKSTSMISRWENGNCLPNSNNLFKLAMLYRVLIDALYSDLLIKVRNDLLIKEEEFQKLKKKKSSK